MSDNDDNALSSFERKVLFVVTNQKQTKEEILKRYLEYYPRNLIMKTLMPQSSVKDVRVALFSLLKNGYICKDLTIFTDRLLDRDTKVFWLSEKGRVLLSHKK